MNNLLLLNQLPDVAADLTVGRKHFAIAYGNQSAIWIYITFNIAAYLSLLMMTFLNILPTSANLAQLGLLLAIPASIQAINYNQQISKLHTAMVCNVAQCLIVPILLAIGIMWQ